MAVGATDAASGGLDDPDAAFSSRRGRRLRCCCFPWPPAPSPHARRADEEWWHGVGEGDRGAARRRWWWRRGVDALMKAREWSELVAGPRWKTFIRRFRRRGPRLAAAAGDGGGGGKLNYDPLSYALNFDEGHHGGSSPKGGGDGAGYRNFSARFVAPYGKASVDLGGRDAPPLFHQNRQPLPPPRSPRAPTVSVSNVRG